MKKIILLLALLTAGTNVWAYNYSPFILDAVNENQITNYSPATGKWSRNLKINDYVFTKHITHGSGGYSEYKFKDKTYDTNSTYEFFYGGKLIGYNAHQLKFYEENFDGEKFTQRELTYEEVAELFPDVELVKISDFKDNTIDLELPVFQSKTFMLLNDTDQDFYKYTFEYFQGDMQLIKGIFETRMPRLLYFSHFKSKDPEFPRLKIRIKPLFHFEGPDFGL